MTEKRLSIFAGTLLLLLLAAALVLPGCGNDAPEPGDPAPADPVSTEPAGPVVPEQGVEVIIVRSHETIPTLNPPEPTPMTADEAYAAVQSWLVTAEPLAGLTDALHCEVMPGDGRVRFWIKRSDAVSDERAVELAEALASGFIASAEARFQGRVEVALLGLGKQLEAVSAQRAEAQQTLREYLELNRGVPETRETRRQQAELERDLSVINAHASEVQDLIATLEDMQQKGQPWYRRQQ